MEHCPASYMTLQHSTTNEFTVTLCRVTNDETKTVNEKLKTKGNTKKRRVTPRSPRKQASNKKKLGTCNKKNEEGPIKLTIYTCDICSEKFSEETALKLHMSSHNAESYSGCSMPEM